MAITEEQKNKIISQLKGKEKPEGVSSTQYLLDRKAKLEEPNTFFERQGVVAEEAATTFGEAVRGEGQFEDASLLRRGTGGVAGVASAISGTAYEALPERARGVLSKVGDVIGKGFNFTTDELSKTKVFENIAKNDPELLDKVENSLQVLSDLGIISGEVLGAGETAAAANVAQKVVRSGTNKVTSTVAKSADDLFKAGSNKTKGIRETLGVSEPKNVKEAVDSINNAYKTAFVEDSTAINNRLSKLGNKTGTSTDELVMNLSKEGYAPSVEGKLSRMDDVFEDITSRQNEIGEGINKTLETYDNRISLDDFSSRLRSNLEQSELISAADLDKSIREIERITNSYRTAFGDELTPSQINRIRIEANRKTKAFDKEVFQEDVSNIIGDTTRQYIDDIVPDEVVRNANAEWGRLQQLKETAKVFDNKPIKTADLGKTLGSFGGVAGAGALGLTVAGPGGLVVAGLAAKYGGEAVTNFLRNKKFSKTAQDMIKKQLSENPSVLDELISKSRPADAKFLETLRLPEPKAGATQKSINVAPELPTRRLPDEPQAKNIVQTIKDTPNKQGGFVKNPLVEKLQSKKVYHGSDVDFNDFDISKVSGIEKDKASRAGFWFSDSKTTAGSYGDNVREVSLDMKNPKVIDADGATYGDFKDSLEEAIDLAKKEGNDGLIVENFSDRKDWGNYEPATHYLVFDTKNILNQAKNTN